MLKKFFSVFFLFLILIPYSFLSAPKAFALTQEEQRAEWEAELAQTEKDIAQWQSILDSTKANTKSLQNDVSVLNAKINQAKAFIKQKNIAIAQLDQDIADKNNQITTLEQKISDGHDSLAQILRKTNELDQLSLAEIVLTRKNLSNVLSDADTFQSVNRSMHDLFTEIRANKDLTEKEKAALDVQKDKQTDLVVAKQVEQKQSQADENQKNYLITVNKTNEKTYEQVLADRQAKAAQIRAALFNLRDTVAIPFGDALRYAQEAGTKTGVRPAFLLAILTQESNLGANVGSCLLSSLDSGDGVSKKTGTLFQQVMKAPRDTLPFQSITSRLGMDWKNTPVSCPIGGTNYYVGRGFGGAMGPSQFIPSTWELMKDDIGSLLGISADSVNPWDPRHAFYAAALYLSNIGASGGTASAEIRAACKYYGSGGRTCSYGNQVIAKATDIQTNMINPLNI